jgi:hypothetical protein
LPDRSYQPIWFIPPALPPVAYSNPPFSETVAGRQEPLVVRDTPSVTGNRSPVTCVLAALNGIAINVFPRTNRMWPVASLFPVLEGAGGANNGADTSAKSRRFS